MARLLLYPDPLSPHQLKKIKKNNNKKDVVIVGPSLTNLSGSEHGSCVSSSGYHRLVYELVLLHFLAMYNVFDSVVILHPFVVGFFFLF